MATANEIDLTSLQDQIDALAAQITKQGAKVRDIKKNSSSDANAIADAVDVLQKLKIEHGGLLEKMKEMSGSKEDFNRQVFDELILRKMFVIPSFEIHGGVKGLFDLGPPACALKVRRFPYGFIVKAICCILIVYLLDSMFMVVLDAI
jgi:glycyl-tRNA synthetase